MKATQTIVLLAVAALSAAAPVSSAKEVAVGIYGRDASMWVSLLVYNMSCALRILAGPR